MLLESDRALIKRIVGEGFRLCFDRQKPNISNGQVRLEANNRLRLTAIYKGGPAIIITLFDQGEPKYAESEICHPSTTRRRVIALESFKSSFLSVGEKHAADLLNRDAQIVREHDGIGNMPAIEARKIGARTGVRSAIRRRRGDANRRAGVNSVMPAQSVRASHIVLEAGAAVSRKFAIAVAIDLYFSLAVPVAFIEDADDHRTAEETHRPFEPLRDDKISTDGSWILAPKRSVQVAGTLGNRGLQCVVDLVIESDVARRL